MSLLDIGIPRSQWLLGIRMRFPKFFEHSSRDDPHLGNLACSRIGIKTKHYGVHNALRPQLLPRTTRSRTNEVHSLTVIPVNTGQMQGPVAQQTDLIDNVGLYSLR